MEEQAARLCACAYPDCGKQWIRCSHCGRELMEEQAIDLPPIGAYVLATKYSDGDPGDAWALGFYDGVRDDQGRHYVKNSKGEQIRGNGYRRVRAIRPDVGRWLLEVAAPHLERCPPGTVNLWTMLTDRAFDLGEDAIRSGLPSSPAT